ncbi:hypothetical protein D3C75_1213050 [compost metagenome]
MPADLLRSRSDFFSEACTNSPANRLAAELIRSDCHFCISRDIALRIRSDQASVVTTVSWVYSGASWRTSGITSLAMSTLTCLTRRWSLALY